VRGWLVGLAALCALLCVPAAAPGAAVTYQADVAHSGFVADGPNPPLGRKWIRRDLGTSVSYPVIAEGKVYVTAVTGSSTYGTNGPTLLYALDRRTGATVWVREVAALGSPAYGNGRIYVLGSRALDAVSAATGERVWRRDLGSVDGGVPVPDGPLVYVSDDRGIHAVSADTGLVAQSDTAFAYSGFALVGDRVYVAQQGCSRVALFTRGLVEQVWSRGGCPGGGSDDPAAPAYGALPDRTVPFERVWARRASGDSGIVVDAVTSLGTEQFSSAGGIALAGEHAYLRKPAAIEARNVSSGTIQWSWPAGSGSLAGSALAVRDAVWTLTGGGEVVALRRADGAELFRTAIGGTPSSDSSSSSSSRSVRIHDGMAADAEGLIVPSGGRLAALGPGGDAPGVLDADKQPGGATSMTVQVRPRDVPFGGKAVVSGEVRRSGSSSSVNDQLELQADPYPYGVWERVAGATARSGSFQLSHRPDRNTRYRVVNTSTAPAVISKTFQVYAYPRFRLRLGYRGRTRTYFDAAIDAPPYLNLSKQRMYVYGLRSRRSVGVRIGSIPLKKTGANRYRARRTIRTPAGPNSNYFFVCIKIKDTRQLTRLNGRKWGCGRSRF
jgi:outer membrane protein assembly factor BamB